MHNQSDSTPDFSTANEKGLGTSILIFGAGKSATCLIDYLIEAAGQNDWMLIIADHDLSIAQAKAGRHKHTQAVSVNVEDDAARKELIQAAAIVVSLLPPTLHFLVALDCVTCGKNLLTASYTDAKMRSLQKEIKQKNLLFICELGLDPGIDHMSAMQLIHRLQESGAVINSFVSHCGGLVAPESDNNPWHYKISWNPRNVVMAGKSGAVFLQESNIENTAYEKLFDENRFTTVPEIGALCWYPNRDSLAYIDMYQLNSASTFIRTTLRYRAFCFGWRQIIDYKLTDETIYYDTDGMTLQSFFNEHFQRQGLLANIAKRTQQPDLFIEQLNYLGFEDNTTRINKGRCSAMDILQFALESKLVLQPTDKDMVVMLHEIGYRQNGKNYQINSRLVVKGNDNNKTAMAKTVGLPLGIAVKLILQGKINITGLHIPVIPEIYEPVLEELGQHGIVFIEEPMVI